MENELQFRFWDPFNEVMTYSEGKKLSKFFEMFEKTQEGDNSPVMMSASNIPDSTGKMIFQSDIIKNHQAPTNEVIIYGSEFCYKNYHAEALPLDDLWNPYTSPNSGHLIIGNIYETPSIYEN